jgi:aminoglycoside phosphotransferase (APT) family kinase protein
LGDAVSRHLGSVHSIESLRRLSGGASRETWSFEAVALDGTRVPLILRRDPLPEAVMAAPIDEYALIEAAGAAGVPVAPLRFRLSEEDGLGAGFVSDFVDGETLGKPIVHDAAYASARSGLAAECGRILARLHSVPPGATGLAVRSDDRSSATSQLDLFEKMLDGFDVARPVLELALRWLRENATDDSRHVLVHGDFRVGNFIIGPDGLRALLDWELAHIGDPAEDIGWLCTRSWRFGGAGRVGGVGTLDDLLGAYAEAGGEPIDVAQVHYWEVHGNLRWGVIAMAQAFSHLHGSRRSVELAAIGRRVAEVEHDLMELLG